MYILTGRELDKMLSMLKELTTFVEIIAEQGDTTVDPEMGRAVEEIQKAQEQEWVGRRGANPPPPRMPPVPNNPYKKLQDVEGDKNGY